jgi:hypothetical protein
MNIPPQLIHMKAFVPEEHVRQLNLVAASPSPCNTSRARPARPKKMLYPRMVCSSSWLDEISSFAEGGDNRAEGIMLVTPGCMHATMSVGVERHREVTSEFVVRV